MGSLFHRHLLVCNSLEYYQWEIQCFQGSHLLVLMVLYGHAIELAHHKLRGLAPSRQLPQVD